MKKLVRSLVVWIAVCLARMCSSYELPVKKHPDKIAVVGQTITIPCYSSNSNPVNWWYQETDDRTVTELVVNSELINGNAEIFSLNTRNYDLTLLSAKWTDSGFYTCVEDTAFGTRHITHLTLRARQRNVTATAGEDVTLVCNSSVARPVNWWYKDQLGRDELKVVGSGEVVNEKLYHMALIGYDLLIHSVSKNDGGVYTCVEDSGYGEHHKIFLAVSEALTTTDHKKSSTEALSTETLTTAQRDIAEGTSERTLQVLLVLVVCAIVIAVILGAFLIYQKCGRLNPTNEGNERAEMSLLRGCEYQDPKRFWEMCLPKKLEDLKDSAIVKVTPKCRDIFALTRMPHLCKRWINFIVKYIRNYDNRVRVDAIVAPDSGYVVAVSVANKLKLPYVPIRKAGKNPAEPDDVIQRSYTNRNNKQVTLEVQKSKFEGVQTVIFINDQIEAGGGTRCAFKLLSSIGVTVHEFIVVDELDEFKGRENLADTNVRLTSLVRTTIVNGDP